MRRSHLGFTLIELVMVMLIIAIISGVVGKIMYQALNSFSTAENISEADWQGFVALERLVDDIHTIRTPADITSMTANQLSFVDGNGVSVQYSLSGTTLLRNSQILASGVTGLSFAYMNNSGAATASAALVRYISISLSLAQGTISTSFSTLAGTRGLP